jgi:hypothetical protein
MANIKISFINSSTVRKDDDVKSLMSVLQDQIRNDFAPIWGIDADLSFVGKGLKADPSSWWLVVLDNADQAGALGYHELTDTGLPLGKVFAATDDQYGLKYSVTASHELLEMLADPDINLTAFVQDPSAQSGRLYAYEVCDACEADENAYPGSDGKTLVSDFVYPSWFESFWKAGGTQFDRQKKITAPFQLLPGGYIGYYDVKSGGGWQQLNADKLEKNARSWAHHRPSPGSRRYRRRMPRHEWMRSQTT